MTRDKVISKMAEILKRDPFLTFRYESTVIDFVAFQAFEKQKAVIL